MIGKVTRGRRVGGLLGYLFGPGKHEEHVNPRVVAAWAPVETLQPAHTASGRHDLGRLRSAMEAPGLLVDGLLEQPKHVWHCSIRSAPGDRTLTDEEWAWGAQEVMHQTGLARRGDEQAVRWVAVRHGDDHVHLAAVLARQDGCRAHPRHDYAKVDRACRAIEARFGLTVAPSADRTGAKRPTRGEFESARRKGREPSRKVLRRRVAAVAATADGPEAFLAGLRSAGLLVRERLSTIDGAVTGYAVAAPGDRNGNGKPVFYGGSKLAPDLSWTRLAGRWSRPTHVEGVAEVESNERAEAEDRTEAASSSVGERALLDAVRMAAQHLRVEATRPRDAAPASDVPEFTAALMAAIASRQEPRHRGPLTDAAELFDRAQREPWRRRSRRTREARLLAQTSFALGRLSPGSASLTRTLEALTRLAVETQRLRTAQHRHAQAHAAGEAARLLAAQARDVSPANRPTATLTAAPTVNYRTTPTPRLR